MADDIKIEVTDTGVLAALDRLRAALGGTIRIAWGTNVVYAVIHQFGGLAGRRNKRVKIPARPYLGVSSADSAELVTIANAHLNRAWQGDALTGDDAARAFGRYLKTSTQLRFRAQRSPDGVPWKPSQRVLQQGGQTLRLTSRLRNSITYAVG